MDRLLIILSDGKYHSGEDLGKELGISRSAVWKQVKKISALGVLLESKKGCGYRISGGLELLDSGLIQQQLSVAVKPLLSNMQIYRRCLLLTCLLDSVPSKTMRLAG